MYRVVQKVWVGGINDTRWRVYFTGPSRWACEQYIRQVARRGGHTGYMHITKRSFDEWCRLNPLD